MNDYPPLLKSHPSARVKQLLASAELDVPPADGKARTLAEVSQHLARAAATTNFSGIALGSTVHRLIGAVTLYGSAAGPWRLILRGSVVGAITGALALAAIVLLRWTHAKEPTNELTPLAQPRSVPVATPSTTADTTRVPTNSGLELQARERTLLRDAAMELDAGRAASALESLDALIHDYPDSRALPRATVLKVKALLHLGRTTDARAAAKPLLEALPSPEATEVRSTLDRHRATSPTESAR